MTPYSTKEEGLNSRSKNVDYKQSKISLNTMYKTIASINKVLVPETIQIQQTMEDPCRQNL